MDIKKCEECSQEVFLQCQDNLCKQRSSRNCLEYNQDRSSPSCFTNIIHEDQIINLNETMVEQLFSNNLGSILEWLFQNRININQLGINHDRLIVWACKNSYRDLVELLLENGANPHLPCRDGQTVFSHAIRGDCTHVIDMLVEYGCDVNELFGEYNYLYHAVLLKKPKMVKCLLHWGFDLNGENDQGYLVSSACLTSTVEIFQLLLSHGIDVKELSVNRETLAERIIVAERLDLLEILLKHCPLDDCESQQFTNFGCSLLHVAAAQPKSVILEYLLKLGLDPNCCHFYTAETALHIAAKNYETDTSVIKLLINYGAKIDAIDYAGNTALHRAVRSCKQNDVRYLLLAGARSDIVNVDGKTVADLALENDDGEIVEWLLLFGVKVSEIERLDNDEMIHLMVTAVLERYLIMRSVADKNKNSNVFMKRDLIEFHDMCCKELDRLRNLKVQDTEVNFYDVLCASKRGLAIIASKWTEKDMTQFYDNFICSDFPIYKHMIWRNINMGIKYAPVYCKSVGSFDDLINSTLPSLVIEKIVDYLNVEDMKNLIESSR